LQSILKVFQAMADLDGKNDLGNEFPIIRATRPSGELRTRNFSHKKRGIRNLTSYQEPARLRNFSTVIRSPKCKVTDISVNRPHQLVLVHVLAFTLLMSACRRQAHQASDHPRLTARVTLRDITFHSTSLNRDMQYRVVLPASVQAGKKLQVVYLLHGGGGGFRDWTNYSDVAHFAESGLLLVMPEGESSYYTNSVEQPQDRFEDYIVNDVISDVERRFPVEIGRSHRAIVGISMGGFGAVKLALHHPELFAFVGGLSSAIDVPRRTFSIKRLQQSRHYNSIFGPAGSQTRRDNDPFVLIRTADPDAAPYFFLTCGEQEGLLPANREFAALLAQRRFKYEFHTTAGSHDWNQWNGWLPQVFQSLSKRLAPEN
jgi:putative tributyrin esterase